MRKDIQAYNSVLELIGNTPLVKLNRIVEGIPGNFYAKVESFNPGHSTKDRIALYIIALLLIVMLGGGLLAPVALNPTFLKARSVKIPGVCKWRWWC